MHDALRLEVRHARCYLRNASEGEIVVAIARKRVGKSVPAIIDYAVLKAGDVFLHNNEGRLAIEAGAKKLWHISVHSTV